MRFYVQDASGNEWVGEARDADDAQENAITEWESRAIVHDDIVTIRRPDSIAGWLGSTGIHG